MQKVSVNVKFNFALYFVARYLSLCDAFFVSRRPVNNRKIRSNNISNNFSYKCHTLHHLKKREISFKFFKRQNALFCLFFSFFLQIVTEKR